MPTLARKGLPAFWCTTLAKALSGDQPCELSTWLNGRFKMEKRPGREGSLANWKAQHSAMLQATVERFRADGWKCDVERFFDVPGHTAKMSGKVDLIAQKLTCRPLIVDVKSGQPRDSDILQVLIEMIAIPMAWQAGMTFEGLVIYPAHEVSIPPSSAAELKPKLFALLKKLGTMPRPVASPSDSACRFCDVPDDECAERFHIETAEAVLTAEF